MAKDFEDLDMLGKSVLSLKVFKERYLGQVVEVQKENKMTDMELNEAEEFEGEHQEESAVERLIRKYDMACKDLNIIKSLCNIAMDDSLKIRSIKMILEQREEN